MASCQDDAVGGAIYGLLENYSKLTAKQISKILQRSPQRIEKCLKLLEAQGLVGIVLGSEGSCSDMWCLSSKLGDIDDLASQLQETRLKSSIDSYSDETSLKQKVFSSTNDSMAALPTSGPSYEETSAKYLPRSKPGDETLLKQTIVEESQSHSTTRQKYVKASHPPPGGTTLSQGDLEISTSAPIKRLNSETIDPTVQPYIDKLKKILSVFRDPSNKDLAPREVAQKSNIGKTKKDANEFLYLLERKGILEMNYKKDNADPRWNALPDKISVSEKDLLEWGAELSRKTRGHDAAGIKNEIHHHHHHHKHKNFLQVGEGNQMTLGLLKDTLCEREQAVEDSAETVAKELY